MTVAAMPLPCRAFLKTFPGLLALLMLESPSPAQADTPLFLAPLPRLTVASFAAGNAGMEGDDAFFPLPQDAPAQNNAGQNGTAPPTSTIPPGRARIRRFTHIHTNLETGDIEASGHVEIEYTDAIDNTVTTLSAENATLDGAGRVIRAKGGVRLERPAGTFTGDTVEYNLQTRVGYITNAEVNTDFFRMRGERIEVETDRTYTVLNGSFTTCIRGRPDYLIKASRLTVRSNQSVSARNITFYVGPTRLISLPSYKRNLRSGSSAPPPIPGYNRSDGPFVRLRDNIKDTPRQTIDYDIRVNTRRLPTGLVLFENDLHHPANSLPPPRDVLPELSDPLRSVLETLTPPTYSEYIVDRYPDQFIPRTTFYSILQNELFAYNRRRNDLNTSRFPEAGVRFTNVLGHNPPEQMTAQERQRIGGAEAVLRRVPNAPLLLNLNASLAQIIENPTRVSAGKLGLRADIASQPLLLGKRLSLRTGLTDWLNLYTSGTAYNLISPEASLNYVPTTTSRIGASYRYLGDAGRTPFLFDKRDIRHDLSLEYQVSGPWGFGVTSRFDLERARSYDTEFAVVRNFDCMTIGLAYRTRSQQFSVIFNLLPLVPDRERRRALPLRAERQSGQPVKTTRSDSDLAGTPIAPAFSFDP